MQGARQKAGKRTRRRRALGVRPPQASNVYGPTLAARTSLHTGCQTPSKAPLCTCHHAAPAAPPSAGGGGSPATEIPEDNPFIAKSSKALKDEFRRDTVLMGSGGSIPICRFFKDILGMDSILVGFALTDDAIHSPNEKYDLESYRRGIRSWVRIMGEFGR